MRSGVRWDKVPLKMFDGNSFVGSFCRPINLSFKLVFLCRKHRIFQTSGPSSFGRREKMTQVTKCMQSVWSKWNQRIPPKKGNYIIIPTTCGRLVPEMVPALLVIQQLFFEVISLKSSLLHCLIRVYRGSQAEKNN